MAVQFRSKANGRVELGPGEGSAEREVQSAMRNRRGLMKLMMELMKLVMAGGVVVVVAG